jgi:hypothetical protein
VGGDLDAGLDRGAAAVLRFALQPRRTLAHVWCDAYGRGRRTPLTGTAVGGGRGLPQRTVFALAEDARGYVYAGTQDGLSRWDGRFTTVVSGGRVTGWCVLRDGGGLAGTPAQLYRVEMTSRRSGVMQWRASANAGARARRSWGSGSAGCITAARAGCRRKRGWLSAIGAARIERG